jgi:hypothetical protein
MKWIIIIVMLAMLVSGCYIRYPSVGIAAARIHHVQKCKQPTSGKVECVHVRTWSK